METKVIFPKYCLYLNVKYPKKGQTLINLVETPWLNYLRIRKLNLTERN